MTNIKKKKLTLDHLYCEGLACKNEDESPFDPSPWIETHLGYYPLTGVMITPQKEKFISLKCNDQELKTFSHHVVLKYFGDKKYDWVKVEKLIEGDLLLTKDGVKVIQKISSTDEEDYAFDFRVEGTHCYLTNTIVSHNSLIALSLMKQPDLDYIVYLDSEGGGISKQFAQFLGINTKKVYYQPIDTIEGLIERFKLIVDTLEKNKQTSKKVLVVVDSISMLSTERELDPAAGCYVPDTEISILKDGTVFTKTIKDVIEGDLVRTHLGDWQPVEKTWKFSKEEKPELIEIETEEGEIVRLTPQHRLLVNRENQIQWIEAGNLKLSDELQKLKV